MYTSATRSAEKSLIVASAVLVSVLAAFAIAINFYYFLAIPVCVSGLAILSFVLRSNAGFAERLLLWSSVAYLILSFLWPRYVAFWIPGFPSLNLQRIANVVVLFVMFSSFFSVQSFKDKVSLSFKSFPFFWICLFVFELFRFASVFFSKDFATSFYQFFNEFFVHAVFVFLGVFFGSSERCFKIFVYSVSFCLLAAFVVGVVEVLNQGNIFSRFVDPENAYVQWALSNKVRGGEYRVQSTFGHPLTFAEFASVGLCVSLALLFLRKPGVATYAYVALMVVVGVGSVLLARSRAGYAASAVSCFLIFIGPLLVGGIKGRLKLKELVFWFFAIGFILLAFVVVAFVVFDHAFGSKSFDVSNSARITMFTRGGELLLESPIVGYGLGLAAEVIGVRAYSGVSRYTIDSLLLSYAVDSGVFAILAFLGCLVAVLVSCIRSLVLSEGRGWYVWYGLIVAVVSFVVFKLILSLSDNNFFMFMIFGIAVSSMASPRRSLKASSFQ